MDALVDLNIMIVLNLHAVFRSMLFMELLSPNSGGGLLHMRFGSFSGSYLHMLTQEECLIVKVHY